MFLLQIIWQFLPYFYLHLEALADPRGVGGQCGHSPHHGFWEGPAPSPGFAEGIVTGCKDRFFRSIRLQLA